MNYLFVLHTINCGGAEKYIINLANALSKYDKKCKVWLYIFDDSDFYYDLIEPSVNVIQNNNKVKRNFSLKWYFDHYIKFGFKLVWQTKRLNFDFIISGYEELSEVAIAAPFLFYSIGRRKAKYISFIHNTFKYFDSREKTSIYGIKNKILIAVRKNIYSRFFVVSQEIKFEFKKLYTLQKCSILSPIICRTVHESNYEKKNKPYVVVVGRINKTKNQKMIVEALSLIKNHPLNVYILGSIEDDEYFQEIKEKILELNLQERVFISGEAIKEINSYFQEASALISVSKREGFPLNIIEAMQFNVPVISTPFPGSEYLKDIAILLKDFDVQELAKALENLVENKSILSIEKQNRINKFLDQFDENKIVTKFIELVQQ